MDFQVQLEYFNHASQTQSSWSRFVQSGNKADLDSAIVSQQAALDLVSHDELMRALTMHDLAFFNATRYERWGEADDLERAIMLNRAVLELLPDAHPLRPGSLSNTANCLSMRYRREGRIEDLGETISLSRAGLLLRPEGHPERSISLNNTANYLLTRYERKGRPEDLEEAVSLHRAALDLRPDGHPLRCASLSNTANCLWTRYEREGALEDLEEAISLHRAAINLILDNGPDKQISLNNAANCLLSRYEREGRLEDLEEAVAMHSAVLALRPDRHPGRPSSLNNTANCLWTRYKHLGRLDDLEEAAALHRASLNLHPEGHPRRSISLSNTANCFMALYEQKGREEDLGEAIALHRAALDLRPPGHPDRAISLSNAASCLWLRYEREWELDDLEEAVALNRAALDLRLEGHPARATSLANTANCLRSRYERTGRLEDLEEAILFNRAALDLRPASHPYRSTSLNNVAICLKSRYERVGRREDLEEAIALNSIALDLRPDGHPERPSSLNNTANCLKARYDRERNPDDLDESIFLLRAAVDLQPEGHPLHSMLFENLGVGLFARYLREHRAEDLEESIQSLRHAATHAFSSFVIRLRAAQRLTVIAQYYDRGTLVEAHETALAILQRVLITRPTLSAQHKLLSEGGGCQMLALDAVSSAIDDGDYPQAIKFLEQGRALLWSQMRGLRTPLEQLSQVDQTLAEKFDVCNRRLEALMASPESPTTVPDSGDDAHAFAAAQDRKLIDQTMAQMRQLHGEQEVLIANIRRLPGFQDFLRAASFDYLQQAACEGPVVVLNHSRNRCDALIITVRENSCVCEPLDDNFYVDAIELHEEFLRVRRERKVYSREYDEILRRVMKFLWDRVVCKVVQKLKELGIAKGSRIWWCPTSVLTAFPFHAAGPYEGPDGSMRYLLDDYISSYSPTLTSLINARGGAQNGGERMLFVGDTKLPSAKKERDAIIRIRRFKQLLDNRATPAKVLETLERAHWVHFACHGQLGEEPFTSSLVLPGGRLTLLDIARAKLPNAEFAFLSACHTAEQGTNHALDEALHLAAAIQFCGFRSVVGTMWQLLDRDGPYLAYAVYAFLMRDLDEGEIRFKGAAAAVREAALRLREKGDEEPNGTRIEMMAERWVNLVHIGA